MLKIPSSEKKFSQSSQSDLFGNINYTKSVNFDERGYVKLAPRSVQVASEKIDSDFEMPTSFGRLQGGIFYVPTTASNYIATLDSSAGFSVGADGGTSVPTNASTSRGVWWQNRWHVAQNTTVFYKSVASGNWTDTGMSLTAGKVHALEVFKNRSTLCVTNGNSVKQVDTSYASISLDLTLPADYEAIGLSYNNNRMAVITKLASTAAGQNQNAFFFVWDGSTTAANQGFDIGSDAVISIAPYRASWVIVTRDGRVLFFNGGGFDEVSFLPFYGKDKTWGDAYNQEALGSVLVADSNRLFLNVNGSVNAYGSRNEIVLPQSPGGVLCHDPAVGLYHRYAPSISNISRVTVTSANVNTTTDILTATAGTVYETGTPIKYIYDHTSPIGGLTVGNVYYVIKHNATQFSLAATREDAIALNKINITSTGAANNYFLGLDLVDFGASYMQRTGGIAVSERFTHALDRLIFGGEFMDNETSDDYFGLCAVVSGFENRGYIVTSRLTADGIQDKYQNLFIKHGVLDTGDAIIVKYKNADVLGLPVTTPQGNAHCTWTSSTTLTTTADLSAAKTHLDADDANELELEVISGAGAGQMAQITSIAYAGGTYTVTLSEEMLGVNSGNVADIIIDNWKLLKTSKDESSISSTNTTGWAEFPIAQASKWIKFKIELRGVNTTIEEIGINNTSHL